MKINLDLLPYKKTTNFNYEKNYISIDDFVYNFEFFTRK